ncbi:MAG: Sec-independent protein translocase protein TatB [Pseudomonadota bacterium]
MFEIGFPELLIISVVTLLVLGPERLPEALRTTGLWFGRMRRSFNAVKNEIDREIGMDEVRRQLHNEAIMEEMERLKNDVNSIGDDARDYANSTNSQLEQIEGDITTEAEPDDYSPEPHPNDVSSRHHAEQDADVDKADDAADPPNTEPSANGA